MKKVLVTGAAGFLGGNLLDALDCEHIVALDIKPMVVAKTRSCVHSIQGDISDLPTVERAIAENEIDTVFHLAAQTQVSVAAAYPYGTLESNIRGTYSVLEACRRQKVKRVVCASSDKSFGDAPVPYKENTPLRAHGIYATSKACGDLIAQSYAIEYGMSVAITRKGNLYGPGHTNWSTLIPGTIRSILRGERPVIRSDGQPRRDYLYVEDAVAGYLALAKSDHVGAMNFGTGLPSTAAEIVEMILDLMKSNLEPVVLGGAKDEIQDQWLDASLARTKLGWAPKTSLAEGLKKTIEWHRQNALPQTFDPFKR